MCICHYPIYYAINRTVFPSTGRSAGGLLPYLTDMYGGHLTALLLHGLISGLATVLRGCGRLGGGGTGLRGGVRLVGGGRG